VGTATYEQQRTEPAPNGCRDAGDLPEGALEVEVMEDAVAAYELERVTVELQLLAVHHPVLESETREGGIRVRLCRRDARRRDVDADRGEAMLGEHEPGEAPDPTAVLENTWRRSVPGASGRLAQEQLAVEAPPASRTLAVDRVEPIGRAAVGLDQRVVEGGFGRQSRLHLRPGVRNRHQLILTPLPKGRNPPFGVT
jgi:hypothetical protein